MYQGLNFTVKTNQVGANSVTLSFDGEDVNDSGYSAVVTPITLTITDTVEAPGVGQLNTPQTIVFPNVHVGTPESQDLSVSNTGSAPIGVSVTGSGSITAQGTIAALAPGATDTQDLTVGVNTSTAGAQSGEVQVDFGSSDPPVDVFGDVYNLATASVAPVSTIVHVGAAGTIAVAITNTATANGFSENLLGTLAAVTGTLSIVSAGPTGEIAAGSSDTSSLLLGFSTTQAGTITGSATLDVASDGGTGPSSIDGLGVTTLTPQVTPVDITVDNYANPVFDDVSNIGTFTNSGTVYALNLGTISQGSGSLVFDLGVLNDVIGPADLASGSLQASGASAFSVSGPETFPDLVAGQSAVASTVTLSTSSPGTFSETFTLAATNSNNSGYSATLPGETLTVTGTVAPTTFTPAIASVLTSSPIDFGAVHVGATARQALSIENTATAGSASLDGSVLSLSGDTTGSGAFTGLAPGGTNSTDITLGINTGTAGAQTGTATLAFVSDAGTLGTASLPNQDITVTGSVYREAAAALLPINEIVHVGDPGTAAITVSNADADDGYSERLIAYVAGVSGDIVIANGGPTSDIAAGQTNTTALAIGFSTAQAGTITGTGTIGLVSDGGTGEGSIDGLGTTVLADATVPVSITVDNYANAELTSGGNLTSNGPDAYTLNLGTATEGGAALSADLSVLNDVAGPADWLNGTYAVTGSSQFGNTGFGAFGTLGAGGSLAAGGVSLATNQVGTYSETIVLTPTDTNADAFDEIMPAQTVTVTGTIAPKGVAQGDVHIVTYDGLRYDFQADGDYVLTRSTVAGDSFQIQIATAPDAANGAVSYTTEAAAQVGSNVVTFAIGRDTTVWVDGTPDTTLTAAGQVQALDGGVLTELSPGTLQLTWATGETATIADAGSHLDTSVALDAAVGRGSMQGLLGTDISQQYDFTLPDGSVLPQPLSGSALYGTFAEAWSVTPANSLLDGDAIGADSGADPAVTPIGIGATAGDTTQFIYADGYADGAGAQPMVQATATGQVLNAAPGVADLSDAGGFGVTFQGTLSELANELISGFSAKDLIDITDLAGPHVTASFAGSGSAGVLYPE